MGWIRTDEERAELEREQRRLIERALAESVPTAPMHSVTAGGDRKRLRGLPAIGRGVSGRIEGTDPLGALLAAEERAERAARSREG